MSALTRQKCVIRSLWPGVSPSTLYAECYRSGKCVPRHVTLSSEIIHISPVAAEPSTIQVVAGGLSGMGVIAMMRIIMIVSVKRIAGVFWQV